MSVVQIMPSVTVADHVRKFGYNPDTDASSNPETITTFGDVYWPTTAVAAADIDIVSTSANDDGDPVGTGARTITIQGLDGDYKLQSEVITLNGQTDVHPTLNYLRIFRAFVMTAGTVGTNDGTITMDVGDANTMAQIYTGRGQTLQAAYTIPANYRIGYILAWNVSVISKTAAYATMVLEVRPYGGAWQTKEMTGVSNATAFRQRFEFPSSYAAKSDVRIRAIDASADNLEISAGFELMFKG